MKKVSIRLCPICNCNSCEVLRHQRFILPEGHPLSDSYDVVCCERCGFVYADTTVSQKDYDMFYTKFSKYADSNILGGGDKPCDKERLSQTAAYLQNYLCDKEAKIIDVGCSNGGLLKSLKEVGYKNLTGIDPSPLCVQNTISNDGIQGFVGTLSTVITNKMKYDCVILSHVMEHIQDLQDATSFISKLLTRRGLVYIEVPDATRYKDYIYAPFQDFNTEHINHFSLQSLSNLFSQFGFTSLSQGSRTINSAPGKLYPVIYAIFIKSIRYKQAKIIKEKLLIDNISQYITRCQDFLCRMDNVIKTILAEYPEIIIWGTGQLAMKLLVDTCLKEAKIMAFVDGNPINQGKLIRGIEVKAPEQIIGLNYPILITSTIHQEEIEATIRDMALPNMIFSLNGNF